MDLGAALLHHRPKLTAVSVLAAVVAIPTKRSSGPHPRCALVGVAWRRRNMKPWAMEAQCATQVP